jgi:TolB-like protein/Tfp pilus assembly protein PilF
MGTWSEIRDRKVLRVMAAYVGAALALWGALDLAADAFSLPMSWVRNTMIASAAGLPVVLAAAWYLRAGSDSRESEEASAGSIAPWKGMTLSLVLGFVVFGALSAILNPSVERESDASIPGFGGRAAIAVMPFENLSEDDADRYFASGIPDDIVTSLQSWGVFPVISRSSTRAYGDRDLDLPSVASTLGVRYVLVGSVRTAGDRVRIATQLVDAESDTQIWASTFDRSMADVFAIQDEITQEIVTAIAPEMTRSEMRRGLVERPAELATWELIIGAQGLFLEGTYQATVEARELLELAIDREPAYALAHARLAEISHGMSNYYPRSAGSEAAAALGEAFEHARRALQLNPSLVDARIWYGHLLLHRRQVEEGVAELREAVRISPSHAQARAELGLGLAIAGEVEEALGELFMAIRLSPNDPRNDRILGFEAFAYLYGNRNREAAETARRVIDSQMGSGLNTFMYVVEISALVREGRLEEARASAEEYESFFGPLDWSAIERGAWSQAELDRVRENLQSVGMIE